MLSRASARALSPRLITTTPLPISSASQCLRRRAYAKDHRAHRSSKKPSSFASSPNVRATPSTPKDQAGASKNPASVGPGAQTATEGRIKLNRTNAAGDDSISKEQPEIDAGATPERNTTPQSPPRADFNASNPQQAGSQQGLNNAQEELNGPHSSAANETSSPRPLPDLRQGIPSTFAAEFGKTKKSEGVEDNARQGLDIFEEQSQSSSSGTGGGGGGEAGGELPKSAYETSLDRRRAKMANWMYAGFGIFGVVTALYMGRNWETEEEEKAHSDIPSGWSPALMYQRAKARINGQLGYYTEPTFPKLLPTLPEPAPTHTLVLSLEDLLIHSEWTREHGWRTAKRPGVDQFLRYLSQYYELVIFTSLPSTAADPVIRKLDPYRIVMWPLFREATRYEKGEYIKDLSYLNRDLSKVILIDTKPVHAKLQPENAIILPPWKGDPTDRKLVSLIPFLEFIAAINEKDVRQALASYADTDIPTEFARRVAQKREQWKQEREAESPGRHAKRAAGNWFVGALGMKPQPAFEGGAAGDDKDFFEKVREQGMKNYEHMEKEIRENGERWLKEMADEEKRFQEESVKAMKTGAFGWALGSAPPAGKETEAQK